MVSEAKRRVAELKFLSFDFTCCSLLPTALPTVTCISLSGWFANMLT